MIRFLLVLFLVLNIFNSHLKAENYVYTGVFPGIRVSKQVNDKVDFSFRFRSLQELSKHKANENKLKYNLNFNDFQGLANYKLNERVSLSTGLAYRIVPKSGNFIVPTLSLNFSNSAGKINFQQRFKVDWFLNKNFSVNRTWFRYRIRLSIPILTNNEEKSTNLAFSLEPIYFLNVEDNNFIENRFFSGISSSIHQNHNIVGGLEYRSRFDSESTFNLNRFYLVIQWQMNF